MNHSRQGVKTGSTAILPRWDRFWGTPRHSSIAYRGVSYPGVKWPGMKLIPDLNTALRLRVHGDVPPPSTRHSDELTQAQRQFKLPEQITNDSWRRETYKWQHHVLSPSDMRRCKANQTTVFYMTSHNLHTTPHKQCVTAQQLTLHGAPLPLTVFLQEFTFYQGIRGFIVASPKVHRLILSRVGSTHSKLSHSFLLDLF